MDEIMRAPNAWPFRDAAAASAGRAARGTLDSIRAQLQARFYSNALEWATDVRGLLSSFLPSVEDAAKEAAGQKGQGGTSDVAMTDSVQDEKGDDGLYTDRRVPR
jgi:hypothetical protein